jgi:phage/plasmid-like protein (TIGR03299 family)
LFRSDTKAALSIVGKDYHVVQPSQVLEFFRDLTELHGYKLSAAGSLFGGKRFWATAEIGKTFDAVKDDEIKGQLLLVTSCDNTSSTQAKFVSERVVCANTLTVALAENSKNLVRKTHASEWSAEAFKIDLGLVDDSWEKFSASIKKLTEIEVTDKFAQKYFEDKFFNEDLSVDDQSTQTYNKIQKLMGLYKSGAGAEYSYGTAYGILNAVTDAHTHGLRAKQDPNRRFWEGSFGTADKIKSSCMEDMMVLAA